MIGMNDAVTVPSATNLRNRFGKRYANTNASADIVVPRRNEMRWSRK